MFDVLRSSRFWLSLAIVAAATLLACFKVISGDLAIGTMSGLLGGFGVGKAWGDGFEVREAARSAKVAEVVSAATGVLAIPTLSTPASSTSEPAVAAAAATAVAAAMEEKPNG